MQLETLDFYEFFKDEYSLLNGGEGVGASGIITPLQMINVVNLPKKDEITREKGDWGSGYHIDTYQKIFELIYQLNDEPNWINSNKKAKSKIITDLLERTITIRYTNQYQRTIVKNILIKIPAYVTESQYKNLEMLNDIFSSLSRKNNILIATLIDGKVFYPNTKEIFEQKIFDLKQNNLLDTLKYLKENNRISNKEEIYPLSLFEKEQILKSESNSKDTINYKH